jgi:GMP synthase (glutamine-hydrolysing)
MTTILIVEGNTPALVSRGRSGARGFVDTLAALRPDVTTRIAAPYAMPLSLTELEGVDAVIFTGAGVPWSVDAPEAAPQRAAFEVVLNAGLLVWGSCNGMQLAAVVLGGAVGASDNGLEVGMARDIWLTGAGQYHPMMAGRLSGFAAPCVHRDEVTALPGGMVLLAGNDHSSVQAVAHEVGGVRFWGTQYHPELGPAGIATYLRDEAGIFAEHAPLAEVLMACDADPSLALHLGAGADDLAPAARASELVAWISQIAPAQPLSPVATMGYEQRETSHNPQQAHEIHAFLAETPSGHDRDA